ncbi:MAG: T9SS type A sorting domain-containing protein [Bacteroidales bacterium]|nr:T9SS type A sorting domain-containing protein [Bacteroidales bacterium]
MRKAFLFLIIVLGLNTYAQQRVAKNDIQVFKVDSKKGPALGKENVIPSAANFAPQTAKSVVVNRYENLEDCSTMFTYYDLQSNSWCSNRMYQLPNGKVGVVSTMSHQTNQTASDRGTGYNFYNGNYWQNQPSGRIEDIKTGWPTIAQWGDNGEILLCHSSNGIQCYTRTVAGQGTWVSRGLLPAAPAGYPYNETPAWPRVATSGNNHNIIHVIADLQHTGDVTEHHQIYYRSTDAVNWTVSYSPLSQHGEETGHYSADSYNISANGHTVAMIYGDNLQSHVVMYKSNNDGQTWTRKVIWQNPYYGYDWETDPNSIFTDTVFGPANLALAVDNNGVAHVAMSAYEYIHSELGSTYTTWSGLTIDGIYYWNDTQSYPIQAKNGNPHDALRLWWPEEENPDYLMREADSTKWIGYVKRYTDDNGNLIQYENDKFYRGDDYFYKMRSGQSAMPALSIDPNGNIACAWSVPCIKQDNESDPYYYRHIYVSYRNAAEGYWHQVVDELTDPLEDFSYSYSENIFTFGVDNTANVGEFWFGFQTDAEIGLYWGSSATQTSATENDIHVVKVIADPEYINPSVTQYNVTASASPSSGGTVSGAGTYTSGTNCTLHAYANSGYSFVKWTKNGTQVSANPNYNFVVTGNAAYVAHFQQSTTNYTIAAIASPSNAGTITGTGSYASGSTCTLRAIPNNGYTFVNWLENGTFVSSNATYSFTVTSNRNLMAVFDLATTYYTINVSANPTNGGSVSGGGSYASGSTCTLHATANNGYTFVNWTKNGTQVSTNPNYSFTVSGNASYVAHFQQNPTNYTITASVNPSNAGIITGTGTYTSGSTCTLSATPNNNYTFVNWTKNGTVVSTNPNYSFIVTGNASFVANFEQEHIEYTITLNAEPASGGSVSGGGTYTEGSTCVISAMPNTGYVFERWTRNGTEVSTNPTYSFVVNRNATFVAHFTQNSNQATITANADPVEGGAVSGGGTYELGSICTLNAIAFAGYEFVNWTLNGNQVSTEALFSFTVTSNAVYVAHFNKLVNNYTVTVSLEPSSAGSVIGAGTYEEGTSCTLIAIANPTYSFVSWTENGAVVSTDDHYSFTVNRNRNLVAVFSQGLFYTINASAGANGTITPEGEVIVEPGVDKTFAIIPDNGCIVSKVLIDGIDIGAVESYTFRSVNANHSIRAQFSGLGVDDNINLDLKVYPNPANDIINVESQNMKRVSIFNLYGVQIESKEVNDEHAVFSTDNLSQGTYILKVESHDGRIGYTRFILVK